MNEKQPEALRLANELCCGNVNLRTVMFPAAAELRRLHCVNSELLEALQALMSDGAVHEACSIEDLMRANSAITKAIGEQP